MKRGLDPLTNHLKESESSEEYTAGSCRGKHSRTRAPPTGGLAVVLRALGNADVTPTGVQL